MVKIFQKVQENNPKTSWSEERGIWNLNCKQYIISIYIEFVGKNAWTNDVTQIQSIRK